MRECGTRGYRETHFSLYLREADENGMKNGIVWLEKNAPVTNGRRTETLRSAFE